MGGCGIPVNFVRADKLPRRIDSDVERDSCRMVHPKAYASKSNSGKRTIYQCPKCGARAYSWQGLKKKHCWT